MEGQLCYKPLMEDMIWSYSRVKSFSDCPYKWYLKYIYSPKLEPCEHFFANYGSFIHNLLGDFYENKKDVVEIQREFLLNFKSNVRGYAPSRKIFENYFTDGKRYLEALKYPENTVLSVEEKFEITIQDIPFVGYIDLLEESADGSLILIDHKSRVLKPRSKRKIPTKTDMVLDDYLKQLYVYSVAIFQKYGKFPSYLAFNCFRKGEFIVEPFQRSKYDETLDWLVGEVEKIQREHQFLPDLEFFKCRHLLDKVNVKVPSF